MTTNVGDSGSLQLQTATLNRERVRLQRELHEAHLENALLRRQNYQLSALLDTAVSKLEQLGHSIVPPFDIVSSFRSLRAEKEGATGRDALWLLEQDPLRTADGQNGLHGGHTRRFRMQTELKVHRGAVLCARFSPAPGVDALASGSADCSIVVSDYPTGKGVWQRPEAHASHVSDICWTRDGRLLLTASFDGLCKLWDVAALRDDSLSAFTGRGYILSCSIMAAPSTQYCCADSQRWVYVVDTRDAKGAALSWEVEARVTSLVADADSGRIVAGDSHGLIRIWDTRSIGSGPLEGPPVATPGRLLPGRSPIKQSIDGFVVAPQQPALVLRHANDESNCSISHITAAAGDDFDRLIVTSDDDMVRLYERQGQEAGAPRLRLRNLMTGIATRSYTIRASFRQGVRHQATGLFEDEREAQLPNQRRLAERDLVAVGGNDNVVTIFDATTPAESPVLQRLEGHKGRVYGAEFHPQQPLLASYSADGTTRIWVPSKAGKQ